MKPLTKTASKALARRRDSIHRLHQRTGDDRDQLEKQLRDDVHSGLTDTAQVTVLDSLSEAEAKEIEEIDAALDRIRNGSYGRCESCGGAIGGQRLNALPETRYCIGCADEAERTRATEGR